ncbi:MAG: peptidoglycan-binding protein [Balneola sp.]
MNKKTTFQIEKSKIPSKVIWVGGMIILLAGTGLTIWYIRRKKSQQVSALSDKDSKDHLTMLSAKPKRTITTPRFKCISKSYPLNYGTCHEDVEILQRYLRTSFKEDLGKSGRKKDGVDGMFGPKTKQIAEQRLGKTSFTASDIIGMKSALKVVGR